MHTMHQVWATYFHKASTNEDPNHAMCPPGAESWCGYQKAVASGEVFDHKPAIPKAVLDEIRGIYRALGDPVLLKKCLHGKTQNANESFNNMVWCRCPKRVLVGHRVFRIAVSDAVICFNEGCSGRFKVIQQLTGRVGSLCRKGLKSIDSRRVSKAEKKLLAPDAKKRRRRQRVENTSENEGEEFYEAGMH